MLLMAGGVGTTARVMLTPAQLRAARALLRWSQQTLASKCGGTPDLATLKRFEAEKSDPKQSTLLVWRKVLSKAGVVFIDPTETEGPGVRLREPQR
jgi:transcriptional regulator with XRE-family HTH domain